MTPNLHAVNLDIKLADIASSGIFEAAVLQRVKTGYLLGFCAVCTATLVTVSILSGGHLAMWSKIAVDFFHSIMFYGLRGSKHIANASQLLRNLVMLLASDVGGIKTDLATFSVEGGPHAPPDPGASADGAQAVVKVVAGAALVGACIAAGLSIIGAILTGLQSSLSAGANKVPTSNLPLGSASTWIKTSEGVFWGIVLDADLEMIVNRRTLILPYSTIYRLQMSVGGFFNLEDRVRVQLVDGSHYYGYRQRKDAFTNNVWATYNTRSGCHDRRHSKHPY